MIDQKIYNALQDAATPLGLNVMCEVFGNDVIIEDTRTHPITEVFKGPAEDAISVLAERYANREVG